MFRLLLLLLCLTACGMASATARDDGYDARPHSLVTTRGNAVRVTVWSPRPGPVLLGTQAKGGDRLASPSLLPWPSRKPPILPEPLPVPEPVVRIVAQPRNGSVRVEGHALVYSPAAGYSGRDQLTYSLTGGGRTTRAVVTIDVGDALRLRGSVVDRGARARVTAIVGSHAFATVADANGDYVVDVIGRNGDMVGLETRAGHVVLGSVLGGFTRVLAEAGTDAVLVAAENNLVQVSGLSTALGVLLQRANGGRPVVSDPTMQRLMGEYDTGTLLDMAGAIRVVADGGQPLPAGIADTRALVSDRATFEAFVASLPFGLLEATVDALAGDPALASHMRAAEVPGAWTFLLPSREAQPRLGMTQGLRADLAAGGRGSFHGLYRTADDDLRWTLLNGTLRLDLDRAQQWGPSATTWINDRSVRVVNEIDRIDVRTVLRGGDSGRNLAAVTMHGRLHFPDDPAIPDRPFADTGFWLLHRDGAGDLPFRAAEIPGVRALPRHRHAAPEPGLGDIDHRSGHALHRFNADGSGFVVGEGTGFRWTRDADGTIALGFGNGEQARVRRLVHDGRKGEGVLVTFTFPDGTVKSKFDLSAVSDGSLAFTTATLAAAWRSGFGVTEPRFDAWTNFHVLLDGPAQTGHTRQRTPGNPPRDNPLSWTTGHAGMVARHYRDATGDTAQCTPGVAGCFLRAVRRWIPLAASGGRIYVSEELWTDPDGPGPRGLVLTSQRGNFYERVPNPGP